MPPKLPSACGENTHGRIGSEGPTVLEQMFCRPAFQHVRMITDNRHRQLHYIALTICRDYLDRYSDWGMLVGDARDITCQKAKFTSQQACPAGVATNLSSSDGITNAIFMWPGEMMPGNDDARRW